MAHQTHHLTCPVCGALPGTSCISQGQELAQIHPSRRMPGPSPTEVDTRWGVSCGQCQATRSLLV
ncbi:zinc finger domain-containing protein, partial [Nonomuraea sp. H19]|uniref:zinc finger domain-containing protein n=1 Tax=Nonomuraea sp. H19 TaxID=3452206 RepID=UPI003F8A8683